MAAVNALTPFVYSSHTEFIRAARENYGVRKKAISLKVWANRLGYRSSRSLELIIAGKRTPSPQLIDRLAKDLHLSLSERHYLDLLIKREKLLKKGHSVSEVEDEMSRLRPRKHERQYLDNETFRRISEWYPVVIRQLSMTPQFRKDFTWICNRLRGKINESQAACALAEWERLAFDRRALTLPEDIPNEVLRTYHKKMLRKAMEAIDEVEVQNREYAAITFRTSKKRIDAMKKTIREIRDRLSEELEDKEGNEVFQLCIAAFPHTSL
jgi:uncharacterized protein (TIGR02147 family)